MAMAYIFNTVLLSAGIANSFKRGGGGLLKDVRYAIIANLESITAPIRVRPRKRPIRHRLGCRGRRHACSCWHFCRDSFSRRHKDLSACLGLRGSLVSCAERICIRYFSRPLVTSFVARPPVCRPNRHVEPFPIDTYSGAVGV